MIAALLAAAAAPAADPLLPLAFLVGHCWRGEFKGSGNVDTHCFEPVYGGKHIRDVHEVTEGKEVYRGETVVSWNAEVNKVEYVYFNSQGGVSKGGMKAEPAALVFDDESHVLPDGKRPTFATLWRAMSADSYEVVSKIANSPSGERLVVYKRID